MIVGHISPPAKGTSPSGLPATYRRVLRISAFMLSLVACLALWAGSAHAEGSVTFYPTDKTCGPNTSTPPGQCRADIEWRSGSKTADQTVERRTLLKVYAKAGETILVASSAKGIGSGNILVYADSAVTGAIGNESFGSTTLDCSTQSGKGYIANRTQEQAGPNGGSGNVTTGYDACTYLVPTGGTGIYDVVMYGPDGAGGNSDAGPTGNIGQDANNFGTGQHSSIAAWDVTVRGPGGAAKIGRLFSYDLAMYTGGNARPVDFTVYPVTTDGYRYSTHLRGMDPNGWLLYGNNTGFLDTDGTSPLYHDIIGLEGSGGAPSGDVSSPAGGVTVVPPAFPIFISTPDTEAIGAIHTGVGNNTIPTSSPILPVVSNLKFVGNDASGTGTSGNTAYLAKGGTFSFTSNIPGHYELVISRDGINFDPTNAQNRLIRGTAVSGNNTVSWDGNDSSGATFPVGNGYEVQVRVHGGEYHFPILDDENNTLGGPTFTVLNPPYNPSTEICPFTGAISPSCTTTAFFDDRAYKTLSKAIVWDHSSTIPPNGDYSNPLCFGAGTYNGLPASHVPASDYAAFSDTIKGSDSSIGTFRAFGIGSGSGSNTNAPCTGAFGDTKILDLWTYTPSQANSTVLNIFNGLTLSVVSAHIDPFTVGQTNASYTVTVKDTSSQPTTGATKVVYVVPAGLTIGTPVSNDTPNHNFWSCTVSGQTVTCTTTQIIAANTTAPTFTIPLTGVGSATATPYPNNQITASSTGATNATTADPTNVVQPAVSVTITDNGSHSFTVGGSGQQYTATVTNSGTVPTNGNTTLTVTLPNGETFNGAPTGTGWVCAAPIGQVVTCTYSAVLGVGVSAPAVTIPVSVGNSPSTPRNDTVGANADTANSAGPATNTDTVAISAGGGGGGGGGSGGGTATPEAPSSILFGVGALAVLAAVQRRRTRSKAT